MNFKMTMSYRYCVIRLNYVTKLCTVTRSLTTYSMCVGIVIILYCDGKLVQMGLYHRGEVQGHKNRTKQGGEKSVRVVRLVVVVVGGQGWLGVGEVGEGSVRSARVVMGGQGW